MINAEAARSTTGEGAFVVRHGEAGDTLMAFFAVEGMDGAVQHVALSIDLFEALDPQGIRARISDAFTPIPA